MCVPKYIYPVSINFFLTTSTDPRYISHRYDILAISSASNNYTIMVINILFTVVKDSYVVMLSHGRGGLSLLG